jgi:ribosomal protein S18 acetylase RimI-like enzyme
MGQEIKNMLKVERLEFDSNLFGFPVGRIINDKFEDKDLKKIINDAKKNGIICLYCLSTEKNGKILLKNGFNKVSDKVMFLKESKILELNGDMKNDFDFATEKDLDELYALSSESFKENTRFYKDKHFDEKKVDKLYGEWVVNLFKKNKIIIARDNFLNNKIIQDSKIINTNQKIKTQKKKIVGFIIPKICETEKERYGEIDLYAVAKEYHGKGYGTYLIEKALSYFNENRITRIFVDTQSENVNAIRIYEKYNFKKIWEKNWYHYWTKG